MSYMKSLKEINAMNSVERAEYYASLNKTIKRKAGYKKWSAFLMNKLISPQLRAFDFEIRGEENLIDSSCVFVCNHSNSHDVFVANEVFSRLRRRMTIMTALDGLSFLGKIAFWLLNTTFMRRDNSSSKEAGVLKMSGKILSGIDGLIFGEATWNLHPVNPMQKLKAGAAHIALITQKPVIPMLMEYVEVPEICDKEAKLYTKCIVSFGTPIYISTEDDLFAQTDNIQHVMESMRRGIWKELGIDRNSLEDVDFELYENHLDLKKNKAFGFKYNTEWETQFLINRVNEIHI